MSVTSTIQVSFGSDSAAAAAAGAHLSVEIDDRPTGLNGGVTSFKPGSTAWFLVYLSSNAALNGDPIASAGSIAGGSTVTGITKVQEISFMNEDSTSIQVPATELVSTKWLGKSLGALTLQGNKTAVQAASKGVAVAKLSYKCNALAFSITAPQSLEGETSFSIGIYIEGKLLEETP